MKLIPVDKDKFKLKILEGYKVHFTANVKGEVTEFLMLQPNGSFKATRVVKM